MQSPTDAELLAEYVDRQSEAAFAQLVERHVALVHSAALRQVGDVHLAEEITQAVFIILARKADKLSPHAVLSGWLCRTAHFAARGALKIDRRRQQREQEAYMQSQLDQPTDSSRLSEATADAWLQIAPLLDGAMAQLREADRNAIVLRIYEQRPLEEVGVALGIGADAAQKRVTRALEKLRARLVKRGVTLTATVIAGAVAANSVQAASVALVQTISAVATAKGAAAGTATLTIVKGAMKIMAWTKVYTATVAGVAVIVAAGITTITVEEIIPISCAEKI
jgi:RNA polymerase sigma factor (sigma-70 family)